MSAGHTPGPWRVDEHAALVEADNGDAVAMMPTVAIIGDQQIDFDYMPNARLIAAAPDLYTALSLLDRHGHTDAVWQLAREALAKAKGGDAA